MPSATRAPATHTQPSRKGKRAWRKNVDLTSIEAGLDAARDEAILTGGKPLSSVDDSTLFQTDTAGSIAIRNAVRKIHKPLRADEILAERSAIAAIDTRKRPSSGTTDGILAPSSTKRQKVSRAELQRLQKLAYSKSLIHTDHLHPDETATHDPWAPTTTTVTSSSSTTTTASNNLTTGPQTHPFIPAAKPITAPRTLHQPPISLARSGKPIPSIPKPNPGRSYNPSYTAWATLVAREGAKEVTHEQRRRAAAATQAALEARAASIAAAVDAREAADPDADADADAAPSESEWSGCASDADELLRRSAKQRRPARKTPAERNRATRRKAAAALERHDAASRRAAELERAWAAGMRLQTRAPDEKDNEDDNERAVAPAEPPSEDESSSSDTPRLRRRPLRASAPLLLAGSNGEAPSAYAPRTALPAAPLELQLAEELAGSLRTLRPVGNLVAERWRSQMERGKIEGRLRPAGVRRAGKGRAVEKWGYKDWRLERRSGVV